jgi:anaerobic ribonucleoside-triphosphate reductase activating protein
LSSTERCAFSISLLRTALAQRRYAPYVEHTPDRVPVQVAVDHRGLWLIGVPRRGDLARIEGTVRAQGLAVESASWRPARATGHEPYDQRNP